VAGKGGAGTLYIEPGSPWERLLRKFQRETADECLNGEIFYSLKEARS